MSDKYLGVSPYVYCGDNPVRLKDEDGRFNREGRATKFYNKAVKRYGENRVGAVAVEAGSSSKPNYIFTIYDKDGDKEKTWTKPTETGVNICAVNGHRISRGREYREYSGTGVNVKSRLSLGAQVGYKIGKKSNVSVNLNSVDLVWGQVGRDGTKWDFINDYGETTLRRGFSIDPLYYNYEKTSGKNPIHSYGIGVSGQYGESANMGVSNRREVNFSVGIVLIFGLHLDFNYKW